MKKSAVILIMLFASATVSWGQIKATWLPSYYDEQCENRIDDGFGGFWKIKRDSHYFLYARKYYKATDYTLRRPSHHYIHPKLPRKYTRDYLQRRRMKYQRQDSLLYPLMWKGVREVFKEYLTGLSESNASLNIYLWLDTESGRVKFIEYDFNHSYAWEKGNVNMRNVPPKVLTEYEDFLKKNVVFDLSDIIEFSRKDKRNGYYLYTNLEFRKIYNEDKPEELQHK